jgi:uncharacterized protein YndB with AHSA1/START domain
MEIVTMGADVDSSIAGREMVVSRLIDAPRALVFEAWTDVRHLAKWWGPDGFTTTTSEMAFAPGGRLGLHDARAGREGLPELDRIPEDRAERAA